MVFAGSSCTKEEKAVTLPPHGAAEQKQVELGENYDTQIFYSLETLREVKSSQYASWTLAFESQPSGTHVYLNGGAGVFSYNTRQTDFSATPGLPAAAGYQFDMPSGDPAQTAIGEWSGRNEVYLIKLNANTFYKLQLLAVTDSSYTFRHGLRTDSVGSLMTIFKDPAFNYVYFHMPTGTGLQPDARREDWDIQFTHYRHIYTQLNNLPYYVTGVLLNPYTVTAAADSTTPFAEITKEHAATLTYSHARDVIGFDWKDYGITAGRYTVKPAKNYIVRTRNGQLWKLHFLDFYSPTGVKGSPTFEVERLQ